ncbi:MAG: hypothetical protein IJW02_03480 [Clostridia bacterium]|nr:hypothetical protein [Clostridia bacterium]
MKRIISTLLVCVLLLGCVFTLASCGKTVSGKYELKLTDSNKTVYDFSMGKVTRTTTSGIAGYTKDTVTEGKYKINEVENDKFEITFTWEVDGKEEIETVSFSEGEENGVKYIKLGGFQLNKVD